MFNKGIKGQLGQSIMELVVGLGLISAVAVAIATITTNSLQNSQFSKKQTQATKLAQENLEKVRAIRDSNGGVCTMAEVTGQASVCSRWEDIWTFSFGNPCTTNGCSFRVNPSGCQVHYGGGEVTSPLCILYIDPATKADLGEGFTGQILIEDEAALEKKVTSRVFWVDSTGQHSSDLITILSKR